LKWVKIFRNVLVVIPEIQKRLKNNLSYFFQLMGDYMAMQQSIGAQGTIRFLATLNDSYPIDVNKIPVLIGGN